MINDRFQFATFGPDKCLLMKICHTDCHTHFAALAKIVTTMPAKDHEFMVVDSDSDISLSAEETSRSKAKGKGKAVAKAKKAKGKNKVNDVRLITDRRGAPRFISSLLDT